MSLTRSKLRVADHGEVFTPAWLVEAMLDLVKDETERIDSRFLERSYPPMTVSELAATLHDAAKEAG